MIKAKTSGKTPAKPASTSKPPRAATKSEPSTARAAQPPALTPQAAGPTQPTGKTQALVALLRRPEGASIEELMAATGWQAHSVRGALSGAIKKKLGLAVASEAKDGVRVYRIVEAQP